MTLNASTVAPPSDWAATDQTLWSRVVAHVQAAGFATASEDRMPWREPLKRHLLAHAASDAPAVTLLAGCLATACMGPHHLWQDLGLSGRAEVSRLMALAFPTLFASNVHDLRWKRHLFLSLGRTLGVADLKPPKCSLCDQFDDCMGASAPAVQVVNVQRHEHG